MPLTIKVGNKYRDNYGTIWACEEEDEYDEVHPFLLTTQSDKQWDGVPNDRWVSSEGCSTEEDDPILIELVEEGASPQYTGGSVNYYRATIKSPTSGGDPYEAECNDIIEALKMNYAEGNAFKAIWRSCAARNLGLAKEGYKDGLYDAEKVVFFGQRMIVQAKGVTDAV